MTAPITAADILALLTPIAVAVSVFLQQLSARRSRQDRIDVATEVAAKVKATADELAAKTAISSIQVQATVAALASKTDAVAQSVVEKNQSVETKLGEIHILVDGRLSAALGEMSSLRDQIARMLPNDPQAQKAAVDARKEFDIQQGKLDALSTMKNKTEPGA